MAAPVVYRPFLNGAYTVSAGLFKLRTQPVPWREDGAIEEHTFALDDEYERYITAKVSSHRRALHEYAGEAGLTPELRQAALTFIASRLAQDSGGVMTWDGRTFRNALLGWEADLSVRWGALQDLRHFSAPLDQVVRDLQPVNALDFLGLNAQEDLAVISRGPSGDWLAAMHVLMPQHWDPRDKLGRDFVAVHTPVAGSAPMNATAPRLVDAVVTRGPFVRFAWGISMGNRLDHHPAAPADADRAAGTRFDPAGAFLRVERQTLTGFPQASGALFTIRPYTYPLRTAVSDPAHARTLAQALRTMTPEQVVYKGLTALMPELLTWLEDQSQALHS